ncbi:gpW family head-tail joining protein [Oceanospirillum sp. HFRX-1_2]
MLSAQERLSQALTARHELQIGQQVTMVKRDGRTVEFNGVGDVGRLDQYIAELRAEVAGGSHRRGPMRVRM